jgi:Uma2 family endonuclease
VASTPTQLMTVAKFERLPDREGVLPELGHGEVICLPPAKWKHFAIQNGLREWLAGFAGASGRVTTEFGFRPVREREYRIADVAFVSGQRWKATDVNGYVVGAPELVIEVLSPSNTAAEMNNAEMNNKERLCLENGCQEFWTVDLELRQVKVATPDGHAITYRTGSEIPLFSATDQKLSVDAIFAPVAG